MQNNDPYTAWKEKRAKIEVPEDFAGKVMTSIADYSERRQSFIRGSFLLAALSSRPGRIAAYSLAGAACAFRISQVLALFFIVH